MPAQAKVIRENQETQLMSANGLVKGAARKVFGAYGVDESHIAYQILRGGSPGVMLDVGAAFGVSLAPFADDGWTVHAFEPDPHNFAVLAASYGSRANVTLVPKAVSDRRASLTLYTSDESPGVSSLTPFTDKHSPAATVEVVTLQDYLEDVGLERVDFLKIDVEGFERNVLKGYDWGMKPRLLVLEFDDMKTIPLGYTWHDLAKELLARGYGVLVSEWYPVVRYGVAHRWRGFKTYPADLADERSWGNLIAIDSRFDDLLKLATTTTRRYRVRSAVERLRRRQLMPR
jgi:FkbM family methyltransferase